MPPVPRAGSGSGVQPPHRRRGRGNRLRRVPQPRSGTGQRGPRPCAAAPPRPGPRPPAHPQSRPLTSRPVQLEDVPQVLGRVLDVDAGGGGHGARPASRRPHNRQRAAPAPPPTLPPPVRAWCAGRKPPPGWRVPGAAGAEPAWPWAGRDRRLIPPGGPERRELPGGSRAGPVLPPSCPWGRRPAERGGCRGPQGSHRRRPLGHRVSAPGPIPMGCVQRRVRYLKSHT